MNRGLGHRAGQAHSVFLRLDRDHMEPLRETIGNSRREAADARAREAAELA